MWWLAVAAWAEPPRNPFHEPDESALLRLEQELVTVVSRYAQTAREAPSIVTVVAADEIRERGYRTVSDVLRTLPGIYVWKSAEGRDLASFRGVVSADNNKVLLLVDGQPWYDGVYTHAWIDQYLPLSNIKQIEVIQGPGSAIYGTNAFSGVVNIVTWSADDLDGARARWMVGSVGTSDVTGSAGGVTRVGSLEVAASTYARVHGQIGDGIDTTPGGDADVLGVDPRSGFNAGARLDVAGLHVQVDHVDYRHTFLPQAVDDPLDALAKLEETFAFQYHDTFARADWLLRPGRDLTVRPVVWFQRNDDPGGYFFDAGLTTTETAPGVFETTQAWTTVETEKDTRRWGGSVDVEARPGMDHRLVAGAGIENTEVLSVADIAFASGDGQGVVSDFHVRDDCGQPAGFGREPCGAPAIRNLFGYAQYTWTVTAAVELTAGARADKRIPSNEGEEGSDGVFALTLSPRVGLLLLPSDDVAVKLLYGRAFRAPSVRELLVRGELEDGLYPFASGNLGLKPEQIDTMEAEVELDPTDGFGVRADASYSVLSREIDKVTPPNQYQNLPGSLGIAGAELGVHGEAGPVRGDASYALTLARYGDAGPYAGRPQYEFPPHMLKGSLRLGSETLSATALGEWYSSRPRAEWSPDAGIADGDPFALLHLGASASELGPDGRVGIGISVRNALDARWGTAGAYRDDANSVDDGAPELPGQLQGEGRAVLAWLEVRI